MRLVFMGTPRFSIPTLESLASSEYDVVAVYTRQDKPAGRGKTSSSPPAKAIAETHGIPVFQPKSLNDEHEIEHLASLKPDVIVVVAYGQILSQVVLDIPKFGCINIHPSLLPRYRGAAPIAAAILSGDKETGVTIMLMDAGMDTGPILSQKVVSIDPRDTTESLEARLSDIGAHLLMETLPGFFEQKLVPERQNNSRALYTKPISKKDGEMNWTLPAIELERRVRAFYPWPGCYTYWQGKVLKVLEAVALADNQQAEPGTVVSVSDGNDIAAGVVTGNGVLGLRRIQLEGKKTNLSRDFIRGQRNFIGERLG